MAENLKNANHYTVRDTINENITVLTHITYALNLLAGGGLILAIVLYFASRDAFAKSHLGFIIKTNIMLIVFFIVLLILFGLLGMGDASKYALYTVGNISSVYSASLLTSQIALLPFIIALGLTLWFFLRILSGWLAFFRKEPLQGHFGIRWRRK